MTSPSTEFHMTFNSEANWIMPRVNFAEKVVEIWGPSKSLCYIPFDVWTQVADEIGWRPAGAVPQAKP